MGSPLNHSATCASRSTTVSSAPATLALARFRAKLDHVTQESGERLLLVHLAPRPNGRGSFHGSSAGLALAPPKPSAPRFPLRCVGIVSNHTFSMRAKASRR